MAERPILVLAEEAAKPPHALAAHDVIGSHPIGQVGHVGDVPSDDDRRARLILPHQLAHLLHLHRVRNDRRDADDVVLPGAKLFDEAVERGEIQEHAGGFDVRLNHHQAPASVEHPQRKRALRARHLIVVKLHRIHPPAAVPVVLAVRAEDAGKQHAGVRSGRMRERSPRFRVSENWIAPRMAARGGQWMIEEIGGRRAGVEQCEAPMMIPVLLWSSVLYVLSPCPQRRLCMLCVIGV